MGSRQTRLDRARSVSPACQRLLRQRTGAKLGSDSIRDPAQDKIICQIVQFGLASAISKQLRRGVQIGGIALGCHDPVGDAQ
jgi:hypothetical protein